MKIQLKLLKKKLKDAKDDPNKLVNFDVGISLKVFIKHIDKYLSDKITEKYFSKEDPDWGTIVNTEGINDFAHYIPNKFILEYEFDKLGFGRKISKVHNAWVRW